TVQAGSGYTVGSPSVAVVSIADNDGPPPLVPEQSSSCGCGCSNDLVGQEAGVGGQGRDLFTLGAVPPPGDRTLGGVRAYDGAVDVEGCDLPPAGFGEPWGEGRSWSNGPGYATLTASGNGTVLSQLPYLLQDPATSAVAAVANGGTARYFDP